MSATAPLRVMVVEDNEVNFYVVEAMITLLGYQVVGHAAEGEAAVAMATQTCPDLILMDLALPNISGIEVTRRLRATAQTAAIRVVGVSAYADKASRDSAMDAGMVAYVTKPIDLDELARVLRAAAQGEL